MNRLQSLIFAAFLANAPAFAAEKAEPIPAAPVAPKVGQTLDFKTAAGHEMKRAILRRIEPDGLTFETKTGLEKLPLTMLPEDLAVHFKYDPDEVARYVEKQQAAQRAIAAKLAADADAAKRAEQAKAAANPTPIPRPATPAEAPMGARGEKSLGSPRLGGKGAEK